MITSKRVSLAGTQLDSVDSRIVIKAVDTGVPHESLQATSRMGGWGQRMTLQHWDSLDVRVTFGIDIPKRQLAARREVFEKVVAWALSTGWLTVDYMPERRIYVDKAILPSSGDLWQWTEDFQITFRAYSVPFWQDVNPTSVAYRGVSSWTATIGVPGQFRTVADVTFHNATSDTMTSFSITIGGRTLALSGISLAGGADLVISHGTDGLLRVTAGGTSVYDKITAASADDLYIDPGTAAISMTAGKSGNITVSCYGRYA